MALHQVLSHQLVVTLHSLVHQSLIKTHITRSHSLMAIHECETRRQPQDRNEIDDDNWTSDCKLCLIEKI